MRRIGLIALVLALAGAACESSSPTEPIEGAPRFAISDGVNGEDGNEHFFWLPPMINPAPTFTGTFQPDAAPTIVICRGAVMGCAAPLETFTTETGLEVSILEEWYAVDWYVFDYPVNEGDVLRISAVASGQLLGFADLTIVDKATGKLRKELGDEYILLAEENGKKFLKIRFRIEEGAISLYQPVRITGGSHATCALDQTGLGYCWGSGAAMGRASGRTAPVPLYGGHMYTEISMGAGFSTCGVTTDGEAYCWGNGNSGVLGNGSEADKISPTAVAGKYHFKTISTGTMANDAHSCGVLASGEALCWGSDQSSKLGDGPGSRDVCGGGAPCALVPVEVAGGISFQAISAGGFHTCGLDSGGYAYCWGSSGYGQLGNGTRTSSPVPVPVSGGHQFIGISSGYGHVCALEADGDLYCWGRNRFGETGTAGNSGCPFPEYCWTTPQLVQGFRFTSVRTAGSHTCGLTTEGDLVCWGYNESGQLGDGTTDHRVTPAPVLSEFSFVDFGVGHQQSCALAANHMLYCWGQNRYGQLGDGTFDNHLLPEAVLNWPPA